MPERAATGQPLPSGPGGHFRCSALMIGRLTFATQVKLLDKIGGKELEWASGLRAGGVSQARAQSLELVGII